MNKVNKVLIVDDHKMVMDGWAALMKDVKAFEVVGHLSSGREVMKYLRNNEVDLIIMDIVMGEELVDDGLEATRNVRKEFGDTVKILVVSMHDELGHIQEAIEAKADGYILKTASSDELLYAMSKVMTGKMYHSQEVMTQVATKMRLAGEMKGIELTKKEKIVLPVLCRGVTVQKAGEILGLSKNTIDTHKKNIFIKFEVHKTSELIIKARELGFVRF